MFYTVFMSHLPTRPSSTSLSPRPALTPIRSSSFRDTKPQLAAPQPDIGGLRDLRCLFPARPTFVEVLIPGNSSCASSPRRGAYRIDLVCLQVPDRARLPDGVHNSLRHVMLHRSMFEDSHPMPSVLHTEDFHVSPPEKLLRTARAHRPGAYAAVQSAGSLPRGSRRGIGRT